MNDVTFITGCMGSGKTERLLDIIAELESQGQKFAVFKPNITEGNAISSRSGRNYPAQNISVNIINFVLPISLDIVIVDEVQFFEETFLTWIKYLASINTNVILGGLTYNYKKEVYPVSSLLLRQAGIIELLGICGICQEKTAIYSKRLADSEDELLLDKGSYSARCKEHFDC